MAPNQAYAGFCRLAGQTGIWQGHLCPCSFRHFPFSLSSAVPLRIIWIPCSLHHGTSISRRPGWYFLSKSVLRGSCLIEIAFPVSTSWTLKKHYLKRTYFSSAIHHLENKKKKWGFILIWQLCVAVSEREAEGGRLGERETPSGEMPPKSRKHHLWVTNPDSIPPQANFTAKAFWAMRIACRNSSQKYWYKYSIMIADLRPGTILRASHRLFHLTLAFNLWRNQGMGTLMTHAVV